MNIDRFDEAFDSREDNENDWDHPDVEEQPGEEFLYETVEGSHPPAQTACAPLGSVQAGVGGLGRSSQRPATAPFIKGPLCREWFVRAMRLRKPAVMAGLALWFKAGVTKDEFVRAKRAESLPVRVDRGLKKSFEISPSQMSRGLHALAQEGLIVIKKGGAGRCPVVVIVNVQIPRHTGRRNEE
jgi:hypothetical protein